MLRECTSDQQHAVPPKVPSVPSPEARAQIEWEHHLVDLGIRRYRASLVKEKEDGSLERKALVDTEPGLVIARDLIGPMMERIEAAQYEAIKRMEDPDYKKVTPLDWVLATLPADRLAACTVLRAMAYTDDVHWTQASKSVARAVRDEYDFDRWKQAERAAEKERKASGSTEYVPNMFKLMQQRNEKVDARVFKKWSTKAPLFTKTDWEDQAMQQIGTFLLAQMVECNGWYEVGMAYELGKKKRMLRLTEAGRAFILDRNKQNEMARPYYLPMIHEPRDYRYVDQGSSPSTAA